MILSDEDIRDALKGKIWHPATPPNVLGRFEDVDPLIIDPLIEENIQPASVDLTLGDEIQRGAWKESIPEDDVVAIASNEFCLTTTEEWVEIPNRLVATVEGKSSIGRLGLQVHMSGYVDPGFKGKLTLQLKNLSDEPIYLQRGNKICQLSFHLLNTPASEEYGHENRDSKYQNQKKVETSQYKE